LFSKRIKRVTGFFVYIAECCDGTYITGMTRDLKKEEEELNGEDGGCWYLRSFPQKKPVKIIWSEENSNFRVAFKKHLYLKDQSRRQREKIMKGPWPKGVYSDSFLKIKDNLIS
jgi:predicted GIY-YIG superfamily endonuclease